MLRIILFMTFLALSAAASHAEYEGDPKRGRAIADKLCARCHAVGPTGESKEKKAPAFRTFKSRWPLENLEEALAEGIVTGHKEMPEFKFKPPEIADFLSYLEELNQ